ncbi:uncharacterized protein LOC126371479 [Pectinophora gossypiella]|uniref:uncharacterized protein LOC126371479 n=1 Tax=Pectinophora gossypiella TaxID=13191 RepID=UPI00214EF7F8|nr:uncharacterized protein LOC126371479 [Pectinophora gossypiella]
MKTFIVTLLGILVTTNAIPNDAWEIFQINRNSKLQMKDLNMEDSYSLTQIKSGNFETNNQNNDKNKQTTDVLSAVDTSIKKTTNNGTLITNTTQNAQANQTLAKNVSDDSITVYNLQNNIDNVTTKIILVNNTNVTSRRIDDLIKTVTSDVKAVIFFEIDEHTENVGYIENQLARKGLFLNDTYVLPSNINLLDIQNKYSTYVRSTFDEIYSKLYNLVNDEKYDEAVTFSKLLMPTDNERILYHVIMNLIDKRNERIMVYAYKLWDNDGKYIVDQYFPHVFQRLFSEDKVKILYKKQNGHLKITHTQSDEWYLSTECSYNVTESKLWSFIPIFKNASVSFKMKNHANNIYLKLQYGADANGDRKAWGATNKQFYEDRFRWRLVPHFDSHGFLIFCIINSQYNLFLRSNHCSKEDQDVIGVTGECGADLSWYIAHKEYSEYDSKGQRIYPVSDRDLLTIQGEEPKEVPDYYSY